MFRFILLLACLVMFPSATYSQESIKVAVIDSGVSKSSVGNATLVEEDMISNRKNKKLSSDHGSNVASIITSKGVPVEIFSYRVDEDSACSKFEKCKMSSEGIDQAIKKAIERRVDIINLSIDTPFTTQRYIHLMRATSLGIKIIMAAGNTGKETHHAQYAENLSDNILIVGALDEQGRKADFSSKPSKNIMNKFVWKPGVNIKVKNRDGTTSEVTGTSFAAPMYILENIIFKS